MSGEFIIPLETPHLGGYVAGGDEATVYPHLWDWLVDGLGVRSVLDVGCGDGVALDHFRRRGCSESVGVDGVRQKHPRIVQHDFTTGRSNIGTDYDLVWACEFVEHVEERYLPNILDTFQRAPLLLMTHADPGQPGHHHVNCKTDDYWIGALAAVGFCFDELLTGLARGHARMNPSPWNHFVRSGLAFRRYA